MRLFLFALLLSCGPAECKTAEGAPSCEATLRAADIIDDVYEAAGLQRSAWAQEFEWVEGERFLEDGRGLWGRTEPSFPKFCYTRIAARSEIPSGTSMAHEALHCSLALSAVEFGDMNHTSVHWSSTLWEANRTLIANGL